jgi:hypothetical protein
MKCGLFTKSRFTKYRKKYIVYIGLWPGPERIFTKYGNSLNAGTLNPGFTVLLS